MALKTKSQNPKKLTFNGDQSKSSKIPAIIPSEESGNKNKHIIFDDGDDNDKHDAKVNVDTIKQAPKKHQKSQKNRKNAMDIGTQWYQTFAEYNTDGELVELKNHEIEDITNQCKKCFEELQPSFEKRNPSDVKWLKTALHKGTSEDRANAGAMLVQTNPLANLETLESLISFTKITNKNCGDSVDVATELFINALLPPWLNSTHVSKVDNELHKTMRIISGTVNSTPLPWLPALCDIEPPNIRRKTALLRDYQKAVLNTDIPLHRDIQQPDVSRLKSRNPPIKTAKQIDIGRVDAYQEWKIAWPESVNPSVIFNIATHSSRSNEFTLPRKIWCNLNRLRTGHGRCNYMMHKWNIVEDPSCECGEQYQTTNHMLLNCPVWSYEGEIDDLYSLTPSAVQWLKKLQL